MFGTIAEKLEAKFNKKGSKRPGMSLLAGILCLSIVVGTPGIVIWVVHRFLSEIPVFSILFEILILSLAIGWQSMKEHIGAILIPLHEDNLTMAREKLSMIVSRDVMDMGSKEITGSALESLFENGNDCLFASLFWYAVLGPTGVVIHRLVNTLDAMWGYRTDRFAYFGFAAAKLDDIMAWVPARLTGLCYILSGSICTGLRAWVNQRGKHKSPNAGLTIAAGAGALGITISGPTNYHGTVQDKIYLGIGEPPTIQEIPRAIRLVHNSIALWILTYTAILFALSWIT